MSDTDKLIKEVMANLRLSEKEYSDEPLIFPASKMKHFTPKKYAEMRKIGENVLPSANRDAKIFLEQARFMADFEDEYRFDGEIPRLFPTYSELTVHELRGYFSWRTRLRHGEILPSSLAFANLLAFELINGIGASSPEDALKKMHTFAEKFAEFDYRILPYYARWMHDLIIYNGLDRSLLEDGLVLLDDDTAPLRDADLDNPEELFSAVSQMSRYRIEQSALYKKYPEETRQALAFVFKELKECRDYDEYETAFDMLCGKKQIENYYMFPGMYFCAESLHEDCVYPVHSSLRYICRNGFWMREKAVIMVSTDRVIASLLKDFDCEMRKRKGLKALKPMPLDTRLYELIIKGINKYDAYRLEQSRPKISIDISKLDGIRTAAKTTCEKLITEADIDRTEPEAEIRHTEVAAPKKSLSPENELIRLLLSGEDYKGFLRENGYMLSVLVDSINEKYFDLFGDTVIDFDGETPFIIEDYAQELKGVTENEGA